MLGFYKKELSKIATYPFYNGEVITSLLLDCENGWCEDLVNGHLVKFEDYYRDTAKNLADVTNIKGKYLTKKAALKHYKSVQKDFTQEESISV